LGWPSVWGQVWTITPQEAFVWWVETTVQRHGTSVLERIRMMEAVKAYYEELYPSARVGGDHTSDASSQAAEGFVRRSATAMKVSARKLYAEIKVAHDLSPDVDEVLRDTKLANNLAVLRRIAKAARDEQVAMARKELEQSGKPSSRKPRATVAALGAPSQALPSQSQPLTRPELLADLISRYDSLPSSSPEVQEDELERLVSMVSGVALRQQALVTRSPRVQKALRELEAVRASARLAIEHGLEDSEQPAADFIRQKAHLHGLAPSVPGSSEMAVAYNNQTRKAVGK